MSKYMNPTDGQYRDALWSLLHTGNHKGDRTGTGTRSLYGHQMRFDLNNGFPILTTKKVNFHAIVVELIWFLKGDTNVRYLHEHGVHIWDEWADKYGNLGPVYGSQWRSWMAPVSVMNSTGLMQKIDQIANVIESIKKSPDSRRHIVTAWNPAEVDNMALPPCHCFFQFYVAEGRLSCQMYQRSADWFLGVPFNIASYALLTHLIARECGLGVGEFIHTFGDYHLYQNHIGQATLQLQRVSTGPEPKLVIMPRLEDADIFHLTPSDFELVGYNPLPYIKAPIAV